MAIAELVAQMRKTLEYHQGTLSFQIPHDLRRAILGRDLDAHKNTVHTRICFYYLYSFVFTQFSQNFADRSAIPSVYQLASEFRSENDVILAVPTGMV